MNSDSDRYLNRLVVAALTLFVIVSLLLAAVVTREIWLQQRMAGISSTLQSNLEELEQTTEEIQSQMAEIETASESAPESQEWDDVNNLLEDVNEQLETIEENIDNVELPSEEELESTPPVDNQEPEVEESVRAQADQVFTIFAVLAGLAAIAIAILLGVAMRMQDSRLLV
jgi:ABC-type multidrug transport system fused ATPase/permease subunit